MSQESKKPFENNGVLLEVKRLSPEEQDSLKVFFYNLFATNALGYTLFGDKPMSFCFPLSSIIGIATKECFFHLYMGGHLPIRQGWEVWKKLKKSPERNFIFIVHERYHIPEMMVLINKKEFVSIFNKNIAMFRNSYGMQITAEAFLQCLIDKKITIQELFERNDLLGVLLGYGRCNAELFQKRYMLSKKRNLLPFWNSSIDNKRINEELDDLDRHLSSIQGTSVFLMPVTTVCFAADPQDPETKILKKKYGLLHKELMTLFLQEDWLDRVIAKLECFE